MALVHVKIKIKEVLAERGMTQRQLAEMAEIREATISDFCRGVRTVINVEHLAKIANTLGITDIREMIDFVPAK